MPADPSPHPDALRFVVQKHPARRLHYDVRLEMGGVLASWAVPRGPSYDPGARRLAVHVGDHEMAHRHFEGPTGRSASGTALGVIIWDEGTYRNESNDDGRPVSLGDAVERGRLTVVLEGTKLRGGWHLVRTAPGAWGRDSWLMIKRRDADADPLRDVEADEPASVRSGLTLEQVAASAD